MLQLPQSFKTHIIMPLFLECTELKFNFTHIYMYYIFMYVLYGCETLSLTLRKKHMLRILKNSVILTTGNVNLG